MSMHVTRAVRPGYVQCEPSNPNYPRQSDGELLRDYDPKSLRKPVGAGWTRPSFCGTERGWRFPRINSAFTMNIDEYTTGGTRISPQQNGYVGSSSTETPTLNPDPNWVQLVTGVGAAMDGSGNLWVLNSDTFGNLPGNALVEYIGIGAPVITPTASAQANGLQGVRP